MKCGVMSFYYDEFNCKEYKAVFDALSDEVKNSEETKDYIIDNIFPHNIINFCYVIYERIYKTTMTDAILYGRKEMASELYYTASSIGWNVDETPDNLENSIRYETIKMFYDDPRNLFSVKRDRFNVWAFSDDSWMDMEKTDNYRRFGCVPEKLRADEQFMIRMVKNNTSNFYYTKIFTSDLIKTAVMCARRDVIDNRMFDIYSTGVRARLFFTLVGDWVELREFILADAELVQFCLLFCGEFIHYMPNPDKYDIALALQTYPELAKMDIHEQSNLSYDAYEDVVFVF